MICWGRLTWFTILGEGHVRDCLQTLCGGGLREERNGARITALSLQGVRLQFHGDQTAREAGGAENPGAAVVWDGQRKLSHDRPVAWRLACGRLRLDSRGGGQAPRTGNDRRDGRPDARRDVAFS